MIYENESQYQADEVDLGDGVFGEVVYDFSYRVNPEAGDVDITSIDDMHFKKMIGPDGEDLPLIVNREHEHAARQEFWKIFVSYAEKQIRNKIEIGEITTDG